MDRQQIQRQGAAIEESEDVPWYKAAEWAKAHQDRRAREYKSGRQDSLSQPRGTGEPRSATQQGAAKSCSSVDENGVPNPVQEVDEPLEHVVSAASASSSQQSQLLTSEGQLILPRFAGRRLKSVPDPPEPRLDPDASPARARGNSHLHPVEDQQCARRRYNEQFNDTGIRRFIDPLSGEMAPLSPSVTRRISAAKGVRFKNPAQLEDLLSDSDNEREDVNEREAELPSYWPLYDGPGSDTCGKQFRFEKGSRRLESWDEVHQHWQEADEANVALEDNVRDAKDAAVNHTGPGLVDANGGTRTQTQPLRTTRSRPLLALVEPFRRAFNMFCRFTKQMRRMPLLVITGASKLFLSIMVFALLNTALVVSFLTSFPVVLCCLLLSTLLPVVRRWRDKLDHKLSTSSHSGFATRHLYRLGRYMAGAILSFGNLKVVKDLLALAADFRNKISDSPRQQTDTSSRGDRHGDQDVVVNAEKSGSIDGESDSADIPSPMPTVSQIPPSQSVTLDGFTSYSRDGGSCASQSSRGRECGKSSSSVRSPTPAPGSSRAEAGSSPTDADGIKRTFDSPLKSQQLSPADHRVASSMARTMSGVNIPSPQSNRSAGPSEIRTVPPSPTFSENWRPHPHAQPMVQNSRSRSSSDDDLSWECCPSPIRPRRKSRPSQRPAQRRTGSSTWSRFWGSIRTSLDSFSDEINPAPSPVLGTKRGIIGLLLRNVEKPHARGFPMVL